MMVVIVVMVEIVVSVVTNAMVTVGDSEID